MFYYISYYVKSNRMSQTKDILLPIRHDKFGMVNVSMKVVLLHQDFKNSTSYLTLLGWS